MIKSSQWYVYKNIQASPKKLSSLTSQNMRSTRNEVRIKVVDEQIVKYTLSKPHSTKGSGEI